MRKIEEAMMKAGHTTGQFNNLGVIDSRTRNDNISQINNFLNTSQNPSIGHVTQSTVVSRDNSNFNPSLNSSIEAGNQINQNKSVF